MLSGTLVAIGFRSQGFRFVLHPEGRLPVTIPGGNSGINRLKNEGFHAHLPGSILPCGAGLEESRCAAEKRLPSADYRQGMMTLVMFCLLFFHIYEKTGLNRNSALPC
jgi:hypothetical protein